MPFFGIQEDNKILMEPYETSFIEKFKTALNKYAKITDKKHIFTVTLNFNEI